MRKVVSVALLNLKQGMREKLFWGVAFFFIFLLGLSVLLGELAVGEGVKVMRNAGLAGIELSALVLVVFSLTFSFYRDRDARMLEVYLSYFSRGAYIGGKLLGYLLICLFYLIIAGAGWVVILLLHNAFTYQIFGGLLSLFLKLSIVISFTLVFCTIFSSPIIASLGSLFIYGASEMAGEALRIVSLSGSPIQLTFFRFLHRLLPNMARLDVKSYVAYGELPSLSFFASISLYTVIYIVFLLLISRFMFLKREY